MSLCLNTILFFAALLFPFGTAVAIDFDQDGFDDFVLIDINPANRLIWYAIDVNDSTKRPLGPFGRVGDHLAVGEWFGSNLSSVARIQKKTNGSLEWDIAMSGEDKQIPFGSSNDTVMSGFDADNNGAIDPVVVSVVNKSYSWKVLPNPALLVSPVVQEVTFGSKKESPFYANLDGSGDKISTAKVNNKGVLTIRYKNMANGKVKSLNIKNYRSRISKIIPAALPSGKDALFVISKKGKKYSVTILNGKKKVKTLKVNGDEFVVGKYLGDGREVLVVRNSQTTGTFIDTRGKRSVLNLDLSGILADDININSFKEKSTPNNPPPSNPTPDPSPPSGGGGRGTNPTCSGTQLSTEHLLYKPVSDTSGNAVIVFDSTYGREFAAVKIELRDGTFAEGWWKGLELWGNPDAGGPRQHWRTNVRASQVKDGALIVATDTSQECRFVLPGASNRRWE